MRLAYQGAEQYGLHYFILLPEEGVTISFQTNVVCKNWGGEQCPKYVKNIVLHQNKKSNFTKHTVLQCSKYVTAGLW